MAERLLMHGTADSLVRKVIDKTEPLFGYSYPDDPAHSGTLTDNHEIAWFGALEKIVWEEHATPVILHFRIPEEEITDHGAIGGNSDKLRAYSTTIAAQASELPKAYLDGLVLTPEEAAKRIAENTMLFFKVPPEYLIRVEELENPLKGLF